MTTIVNVAGSDIDITGNFNQNSGSILFNFYEADRLDITSTFNFSVLAPFADVLLAGGGMNGTLVAGTLDQRSELRPYDFHGTESLFVGPLPQAEQLTAVPLPAAGAMLLAALGGLFGFRRRA